MAKSYHQKRSRLQESRIAEEIGGRVQAGSGSSWSAKSDVRKLGKLRIEAKFTEKQIYKLKLEDLLKIRDEAIKGGLETPIMQVEFIPSGAAGTYKLAVMDYQLFRHWHGFSQEKTIFEAEFFCVGKQFSIDWIDARVHFVNAISKLGHGVWRVVFQTNDWKRSYAVIEWDLFTTLYEESEK